MTRDKVVGAVTIVLALVFVALAVWLAVGSVTTAQYPPLTIDDRTVGGPYSLTTYSGSRIGGATLCVLAAVVATCVAVTKVLPRRRRYPDADEIVWTQTAVRPASRR